MLQRVIKWKMCSKKVKIKKELKRWRREKANGKKYKQLKEEYKTMYKKRKEKRRKGG